MLTEDLRKKYLTEQPFHNLVNALTQLVEKDKRSLGEIREALTVVEHKLHENAATRER